MADTFAPPPGEVTPSAETIAPAALKGWSALQFAVNTLLPRDLTSATNVRLATLRVLRRG